MSGPPRKPSAWRRAEGNRGKRAWNHAEPAPPRDLPRCPSHLGAEARREWRRLVGVLHDMGVITVIDRAVLAAYCQAWGRWVEAETKLKESPLLIRTPSGYVQQSPWLSVANRQMELMGRYMAEIGLTPAARSRIVVPATAAPTAPDPVIIIRRLVTSPTSEEGGMSGGEDGSEGDDAKRVLALNPPARKF